MATLIQYFSTQMLNIPFPPEEIFRLILSPVPGSIQSIAVDRLGEYAKYIAFTFSTVGYILLYGVLGAFLSRLRLSERSAIMVAAVLLTTLGLVFDFQVAQSYSLLSTMLGWVLSVALVGLSNFAYVGVFIGAPRPVHQRSLTSTASGQQVASPRRSFLMKAIGLGVVAVAAIIGIELGLPLFSGQTLSESENPIPLNTTNSSVTPTLLASTSESTAVSSTSAAASSTATGLAPVFMDPRISDLLNSEVTNNSTFYRVDIDPEPPVLDFDQWRLDVNGKVVSPFTIRKQELLTLPTVDEYVTLECVSNTIDPPAGLISNAKWTGVPLSYLLNRAGFSSDAKYVVFHSADGYAVGIPFEVAMRPETILAYKMNGVFLPQEHGSPLRAIVPGIYGMMNAKWITSIEVVDYVFLGYWQTRGWSNDATIKTTSIIYYPSQLIANGGLRLGPNIPIAGVAFAGERGISKVEVSTDGGISWSNAYVKPPVSSFAWILWAYPWTPSSKGQHQIMVRATDGTGALQSGAGTDSYPNGATGYNVVMVYIS